MNLKLQIKRIYLRTQKQNASEQSFVNKQNFLLGTNLRMLNLMVVVLLLLSAQNRSNSAAKSSFESDGNRAYPSTAERVLNIFAILFQNMSFTF